MKFILIVMLILARFVFAETIYLSNGNKIVNCRLHSVYGNNFEIAYFDSDSTSTIKKLDGNNIIYIDYSQYNSNFPSQTVFMGNNIYAEIDSIKSAKINPSVVIKKSEVKTTMPGIYVSKEGAEIFRLIHTVDNVIWGVSSIALGATCFGYGLYVNNLIKSDSYFSDLKSTRNLFYGLGVISAGFGIFIISYENDNWKVNASSNYLSIRYNF